MADLDIIDTENTAPAGDQQEIDVVSSEESTSAAETDATEEEIQEQAQRTYSQKQLDSILHRKIAKATSAAQAQIAALQAELDGLKNEKFLAGKGVPGDMTDYLVYKIGKERQDGETFEQAAERFLENVKLPSPSQDSVRISTGGGISSPAPQRKVNDMNTLLRNAIRWG